MAKRKQKESEVPDDTHVEKPIDENDSEDVYDSAHIPVEFR